MVQTRGHSRASPDIASSPAKSTRARSKSPVKRATRTSTSPTPAASPSKRSSCSKQILVPEIPVDNQSRSKKTSSPQPAPTPARASRSRRSTSGWSHTPSILTLAWLTISLPLVIWDCGYVLLRPHTMAGGKYVWPFYEPYKLYSNVDYMYGDKAWDEQNGFTAAQSWFNVFETIGYCVYLYFVCAYSTHEAISGRGAPSKKLAGRLAHSRTLHGRVAAIALLLAFSMSVMTLSKTALYWLTEACSGFAHTRHNDFKSLLLIYLIPNGAWLVFPTYMVYVFGSEILQGLEAASTSSKKSN